MLDNKEGVLEQFSSRLGFEQSVAFALSTSAMKSTLQIGTHTPPAILEAAAKVEKFGWGEARKDLGLTIAQGYLILCATSNECGVNQCHDYRLYSESLRLCPPVKTIRSFSVWNALKAAEKRGDKQGISLLRGRLAPTLLVFSDGSTLLTDNTMDSHISLVHEHFIKDQQVDSALVLKTYADSDEECLVDWFDLPDLVKCQSPALLDKQYRKLIMEHARYCDSAALAQLPDLTKEEWLHIIRVRYDLDKEFMQQNKNRSDVIAEFILERLDRLTENKLQEYFGKISKSLLTRQNIRARFTAYRMFYPEGIYSTTQKQDPTQLEGLRGALRQTFVAEGLL